MHPTKIPATDFKMIATTFFGLEEVLAAELLKLGAKNIEAHNRAVSFYGDEGFLYKANICLRTALRVLKPIGSATVFNDEELYDAVQKINWDKFLSVDQTLAVTAVLNTENFNHNQYVAQKCKDAIVDQFRDKYDKRPSVDKDNPDFSLYVFIFKDEMQLMLDSSGVPLYKRGYRQTADLAPLNEALAAGMVLISGWDARLSALYDPMCGAGTILIEAALIAANIPPGYYRKDYSFMHWPDFNEELFEKIFESVVAKINNVPVDIIGTDISPVAISKARENAKAANVDDMIRFMQADFFETSFGLEKKYTLITNPPYGERLKKDDIFAFYKKTGDTFKHKYKGSTAWIISSGKDAMKHVGLKTSRKIPLFNGGLECRFCKYEMY
ncbi:MAG TPA: THUMP domain-containing protein [Bacteroidia bacterium]|jgi:putative N6-adenine-specific DNA methylase|nr:THUMP domain-containing protein [Bacteroidia bacterium]